jgi:hypothetical protein
MSKMGEEVVRQQELRSFLQENHDYEQALERENDRLRYQIKLITRTVKRVVVPEEKTT